MNNLANKTVLGTVTLLALTLAGCNTMSKTSAAPAAPAPVAAVIPPPAVVLAPAPIPAPPVFVISDVNFEHDKSTLTPKAEGILNEVAKTLRDQPNVRYVVDGHTDSQGTDIYNQALSERRAQTVRDFQINHGVPAGQLTSRAFGESNPVSSNSTAFGRAQNRRVEIRPVQ